MKKVAIYVCGEISERCTGNGCLRAFNDKIDSFSEYSDGQSQLVSFNSCNGCENEPIESLKLKLEKFNKADVDTIHLSTCIRGRCDNYEEFAEILSEHFDVIGYSHGSEKGKKDNTVNKKKK